MGRPPRSVKETETFEVTVPAALHKALRSIFRTHTSFGATENADNHLHLSEKSIERTDAEASEFGLKMP